MEINIYNNYKEIEFDYLRIVNDIKSYFENYTISLILVTNEEIKSINKTYRNKDYETDVISFELDDEDEDYIGDIFISIDKTISQSILYNHSVEREFAFLLTHGILHLLGYDHLNKEDEEIMILKQKEILEKFNYLR